MDPTEFFERIRRHANDNYSKVSQLGSSIPNTGVQKTLNSVADWHKARVQHSDGDSLKSIDAYEDYCEHCNKRGGTPLGLPSFHRQWLQHSGHNFGMLAGAGRHIGVTLKKPVQEGIEDRQNREIDLHKKAIENADQEEKATKDRLGKLKVKHITTIRRLKQAGMDKDKMTESNNPRNLPFGFLIKEDHEDAPSSPLTKRVLAHIKREMKVFDDKSGNSEEIFDGRHVAPSPTNPNHQSNPVHTLPFKNQKQPEEQIVQQEETLIDRLIRRK